MSQIARHGKLASSRIQAFRDSKMQVDSEFIIRITQDNTFTGSDNELLFFAKSVTTPDESLNLSYDSEKMHVLLGGIDHPPLSIQVYAISDESLEMLFNLYGSQFTEAGTFDLLATARGKVEVLRNSTSRYPSKMGYEGFTLRGIRMSRPVISSADASSNNVSVYSVNIYYQKIDFSITLENDIITDPPRFIKNSNQPKGGILMKSFSIYYPIIRIEIYRIN